MNFKTSILKQSMMPILLFLVLTSCKKEDTIASEIKQSSEKMILSFSFLVADNPMLSNDIEATINKETKTITAIFDEGTAIDVLVPTVVYSDTATIFPISKVATDFSNSVEYAVTAEDGTESLYTTTCTVLEKTCIGLALKTSGPIVVTEDNQIIKDLFITATSSDAVAITGFSGVTISNCIIAYTGANMGIKFSNADNLTIENCSIKYINAPAKGPLPDAERNCIDGFNSKDLIINQVRVEDGSTGVRMNQCDNSKITFLEGYNMRGPYPRGQLVQYDKCDGGLLENFSVINDREIAWTEDNISIYKSGGQEIKKGLIIGNNSPYGVGILFEDQSDPQARGGLGGLVEDVDLLQMGNGAVSSVDGSGNVIFRRVRVKNNICGDLGQNRGVPLSNSLVFSGFGTEPALGGNQILEAVVFNMCNPNNIVYPMDKFDIIDYTVDTDFMEREAIMLNFCDFN
ncbi:DUF5018 domain-containing protein [Cellulophaga sp. Asnod2-G02]|uniref:DUF5018 domain-containing protein n=1 Tax=Cellulophaga sp. Asnod2-G02 TaxID=3160572 RepID=UPI00386C771A